LKIIFVGATSLRGVAGQTVLYPCPETAQACKEGAALLRESTRKCQKLVITAGNTIYTGQQDQSLWARIFTKLCEYFQLAWDIIGSFCFTGEPGESQREGGGQKIWMALLMRDYIVHNLKNVDLAGQIHIACASKFTSSGEMEALALYCVRHRPSEIVLVIKRSQERRMLWLCRHWIRQYGLSSVHVTTAPFGNTTSWGLYELLALVKDVAVMTGRKIKRQGEIIEAATVYDD
jgi:hypothetical protein